MWSATSGRAASSGCSRCATSGCATLRRATRRATVCSTVPFTGRFTIRSTGRLTIHSTGRSSVQSTGHSISLSTRRCTVCCTGRFTGPPAAAREPAEASEGLHLQTKAGNGLYHDCASSLSGLSASKWRLCRSATSKRTRTGWDNAGWGGADALLRRPVAAG